MNNFIYIFEETSKFTHFLNITFNIFIYGLIINLILFLSLVIFTFLYFYILEKNYLEKDDYDDWEEKIKRKYSKEKNYTKFNIGVFAYRSNDIMINYNNIIVFNPEKFCKLKLFNKDHYADFLYGLDSDALYLPSININGASNIFSIPNDDFGWHRNVIDLNYNKKNPELIFSKWLQKLRNLDLKNKENEDLCINFYNNLILWLDSLPDDMIIGIYNYPIDDFFVVNPNDIKLEFNKYCIRDENYKYQNIYNTEEYLCIGNNDFLLSNYKKKHFDFEFLKKN